MTKKFFCAIMAMATLFPELWGQINLPAVVTTTIANLKCGVDPTDPTKTWFTTLRVVNRTQALHSANVSLADAKGNAFPCLETLGNGIVTGPGTEMSSGTISPLTALKWTLKGLPGAIAVPMTATAQALLNPDGLGNVIVEALVQEVDSNGKLVQSYESIDPSTLSTATGNAFAIAADVGFVGSDTTVLLSNPGNGMVNVTVAIYDGGDNVSSMQNRVPIAKTQIPISPGMAAQTLSQLFSANSDLANFVAQASVSPSAGLLLGQNMVTIVSDGPLALAVSRANSSPDGSVTATSANFFPLAPPPVAQQ